MEQETKMGWKKYLLIGSLGLNVLLIGIMGGAAFKVKNHTKKFQDISLQGPMIRALPQEQREKLRTAYRAKDTERKDNRAASKRVREELKEAISAVPFDSQNLTAAFQKQHSIRSEFISKSDALWVEVISNMSDAERAQFAADLKFRKPRGGKPKK